MFPVLLASQQLRVQNGFVKTPKKIGITISPRLADINSLKGARINPILDQRFTLDLLYEIQLPIPSDHCERICSIDLGLNNLLTVSNNIGEKPFIISGGPVKSINQYYNKNRSRFQGIYDRLKINHHRKLDKLTNKRNHKLLDYFHKSSRAVINWCKMHKIDTLVIGYNELWKKEINLGKQTNQNFVSAPFWKLLHQLKYKSQNEGIHFITQEESYTSKCSFLDNEDIDHREIYLGKRVKRGLFKSADGRIINADVNAAYNIGRKAFPDEFSDGLAIWLHPEKLIIN